VCLVLLVVNTSASDCLERLVPEVIYYVLRGTLNPTHSLTHRPTLNRQPVELSCQLMLLAGVIFCAYFETDCVACARACVSVCVCVCVCVKVDQLVDMVTGCLRCTYCQSELTEELSEHSAGQSDTRSLMAKFNDQIEPIYALLRKVEDIRLSADILEPEPTDFKPTRSVSLAAVVSVTSCNGHWSV